MKKTIYLAGGCFWGVDAYYFDMKGILSTETGYANGHTANPTYEDVCAGSTGFAEVVKVEYDDEIISLDDILIHYFRIVDPTSLNRQGMDFGEQYRTGIYYVDDEDYPIIRKRLDRTQDFYNKKIVVEADILRTYYPAEDYHQKYLQNNVNGYCHINLSLKYVEISAEEKRLDVYTEEEKNDLRLKTKLSDIQYAVTQNGATEPPFDNEYWDHFERGVYCDIIDEEELFSSEDKLLSSSGWPLFSRPIDESRLIYIDDLSSGEEKVKVKAKKSGSHLGYLVDDESEKESGKRYCINSAALVFKST